MGAGEAGEESGPPKSASMLSICRGLLVVGRGAPASTGCREGCAAPPQPVAAGPPRLPSPALCPSPLLPSLGPVLPVCVVLCSPPPSLPPGFSSAPGPWLLCATSRLLRCPCPLLCPVPPSAPPVTLPIPRACPPLLMLAPVPFLCSCPPPPLRATWPFLCVCPPPPPPCCCPHLCRSLVPGLLLRRLLPLHGCLSSVALCLCALHPTPQDRRPLRVPRQLFGSRVIAVAAA